MNYRQWKKNYKKMHGCNPPFEVDRRKQAKSLKKALAYLGQVDWSQICKSISDGIKKAAEIASKLADDYRKSLEENKNE